MDMIKLAIEVACDAHRNQIRKVTGIPYIAHPFSVGMILSQAGCSEEVIAAGLLHDTIEDTKLEEADLLRIFGKKITNIVMGCTDSDKHNNWDDRKKHSIERMKTSCSEVRMVTCADKIHNLKNFRSDQELMGEDIWLRFKGGRKDQEWYFREILKAVYDPELEKQSLCFAKLYSMFEEEFKEFFRETKQ